MMQTHIEQWVVRTPKNPAPTDTQHTHPPLIFMAFVNIHSCLLASMCVCVGGKRKANRFEGNQITTMYCIIIIKDRDREIYHLYTFLNGCQWMHPHSLILSLFFRSVHTTYVSSMIFTKYTPMFQQDKKNKKKTHKTNIQFFLCPFIKHLIL